MPPRALTATHLPQLRPAFFPAAVFEVARREIAVASIVAADMHKQKNISEQDYQRLWQCVDRLHDIAGAAYGR